MVLYRVHWICVVAVHCRVSCHKSHYETYPVRYSPVTNVPVHQDQRSWSSTTKTTMSTMEDDSPSILFGSPVLFQRGPWQVACCVVVRAWYVKDCKEEEINRQCGCWCAVWQKKEKKRMRVWVGGVCKGSLALFFLTQYSLALSRYAGSLYLYLYLWALIGEGWQWLQSGPC